MPPPIPIPGVSQSTLPGGNIEKHFVNYSRLISISSVYDMYKQNKCI